MYSLLLHCITFPLNHQYQLKSKIKTVLTEKEKWGSVFFVLSNCFTSRDPVIRTLFFTVNADFICFILFIESLKVHELLQFHHCLPKRFPFDKRQQFK